MSSIRWSSNSRAIPILVVVLLATACHDSPRENPLDPVLTPPVELTVALDDTAGTAALTWTPYAGEQPFAEYQVLRNVSRSTVVDTLARITVQGECAYLDTTLAPDTAYEYRVAVVNAGGLEVDSARWSLPGYALGDLHLLPIEADSLTGALTVRWQRYVGPDFGGYRLLRRVAESSHEEVVAERTGVTDTVFVDATAQADVPYVYVLHVQGAGTVLTSTPREARLVLPPVQLTQARFDSRSATASLQWEPYRGPRFAAYQVWRRTGEAGEQASRVVFQTADPTVTACVDSFLVGAIEYRYQVVVVTSRGESVPGPVTSGGIHQQVAEWPLSLNWQRGGYVRLAPDGQGRIAVMSSDFQGEVYGLKVEVTDGTGNLLEEQRVIEPILRSTFLPSGRSVDMATDAAGRRYFSFAARDKTLSVVTLLPDGTLGRHDLRLFADLFPASLAGTEGVVLGEISLAAIGGSTGIFDNLTVSTPDGEVLSEDFSNLPQGSLPSAWEGWQLSGAYGGGHRLHLTPGGEARRRDPAWRDFRLQAEVESHFYDPIRGSIEIGGDTYSRFALSYDERNSKLVLNWDYLPPDPGLQPRHEVYEAPFSNLFVWHTPRLGLGMANGQLSVSVTSPVLTQTAHTQAASWSTLTLLEDQSLIVAADDSVYSLTLSGEITDRRGWSSWISEARAWQVSGERGQRLGLCLPEASQIRWGLVPAGRASRWSDFVNKTTGQYLGPHGGLFYYPLSLAGGADGRFYVLDAGNQRVVVLDSKGQYLTQWGRSGNGPGEFTFGEGFRSGAKGLDYAGSICVDDEGYIYVADLHSGRIQKFEP